MGHGPTMRCSGCEQSRRVFPEVLAAGGRELDRCLTPLDRFFQ
jgi:hypothetical protein